MRICTFWQKPTGHTLLTHPGIPLAFLSAKAHCRLMANLLSTRTSRSFTTELLASISTPNLYWWFLPGYRTLHLPLLIFIMFPSAQFSTISGHIKGKAHINVYVHSLTDFFFVFIKHISWKKKKCCGKILFVCLCCPRTYIYICAYFCLFVCSTHSTSPTCVKCKFQLFCIFFQWIMSYHTVSMQEIIKTEF